MENKTIWITGASSGIGEALALELAGNGNRLVLSSRRAEVLKVLKTLCERNGSECMVIPLDLEKQEDFEYAVDKVISAYGQIDLLINNGGISQRSLAIETSMAVFRKLMEVNFFGSVALTKSVLPHMLKAGHGQIAVISSMSGKFGFPNRSGYTAAKHALQGFFETLGLELNGTGIGVTIVSPGRINTPISVNALSKDGGKHGIYDEGQKNGIPADVCARKIIRAIEKRKREVMIARGELILHYVHRIWPWLYYQIASRVKAN
jgi:short-subunit dehydrogenase